RTAYNPAMPNDPPPASHALTIAAFQQHIRAKYYASDSERGTPGTFMWFIEEVGELATTLHKVRGEAPDTSGGSTFEDLEAEFADVFAWLCTLANINGVDLETAIRRKYLTDEGPKGHK